MFSKLSSKLRSRSGSGNGQKDKSFAYGKMHKPGDQSLLAGSFGRAHSENETWTASEEQEGYDQEDENNANVSHAEGAAKKSRPHGEKLTDGDHASPESWSFEDHSSKRSWGPQSSIQDEDINIGPPVLKDYEDAEEEFLGDFEEYFENLHVENIRKEQYPKLDVQRLVYLDYANLGLFSNYQVREHMRALLEDGPYLGLHDGGFNLSNYVPDAQDRILQLLHTDRAAYSIVFTTGFTRGFRLMGEAFPFQKNSPLLVCQDNHEAVQTLINIAADRGARPILAPIGESDFSLHGTELRKILGRRGGGSGSGGLFVFPVQSCASGVVHSLNWIAEAQQNGWQVLIDTSTYLPTSSLDLSLYQPEFVLGSIAHLLGYPSGIGFLLVRKSYFRVQATNSGNKLNFIEISGSSREREAERDCHILDEDNILNALSFSAVSSGLVHLQLVGYEAIHKRVRSLAAWLIQTMLSLKHKGDAGPPLARVYGPLSTRNRGSVIAFNVLDSTGSELPPGLVRRLAEKNNILISGGHLSSPGVISLLGKRSERVNDISVFKGKANRSALVRVSLGPMSNFQDVYRFAQFLSRFRDEDYLSGEAMGFYEDNPQG